MSSSFSESGTASFWYLACPGRLDGAPGYPQADPGAILKPSTSKWVVSRKVTVRNWWRWVLRGLAVVALVGAVVPLTARQTVRSTIPRQVVFGNSVIPTQRLTWNCLSPFDRVQGKTTVSVSDLIAGKLGRGIDLFSGSPCTTAVSDREHIVEAHFRVGIQHPGRREPPL
jgi:hypothetical protein